MRIKYKSLEEMVAKVHYGNRPTYALESDAKYELIIKLETDTYQKDQPVKYASMVENRYHARNLEDLHLICADQLCARQQRVDAEPSTFFTYFHCQYINTETFEHLLHPERMIGSLSYGCEWDEVAKKRTCRRNVFYVRKLEKRKKS